MPANIREFHCAATATDALKLLQRTNPISAAITIRPRLPDTPYTDADVWIDLQPLGLNTIKVEGDTIRLGALATLQSLVESAPLAAIADGIVVRAAQFAAHFGLRNLATVAGAIDGAADNPPGPPEVLLALLALDAQVAMLGAADTLLPLADYRPSPSSPIAEVVIPASGMRRGALARVARTPLDQAIVAAVAARSSDVIRVAVAGASRKPIVAQALVEGSTLASVDRLVDEVKNQIDPVGDYRGSAEYRRAIAGVLARRALEECFNQGANV